MEILMKPFKLSSNSGIQTMKIASTLAKYLSNGDTVILTGELGCGKTKFVEGFLSYFGLENDISSPTFNIVNEYKHKTVNIYHFDVYRLSNTDEFYAIGGEEYFDKGICLIEWGELINDALPDNYITISFEKDSVEENTRILTFDALGSKYQNILENFEYTPNT